MHLDVLDLRNFYYRTRLGRAAQRAIRGRLLEMWPPADNQTVAGFGFAAPLLRPYLGATRRVIGLMPAQQGAMPWPAELPNVSVLCEETLWPIPGDFVDRLVLLHGLETSENPARLLDECWRALSPGGRAIFIVPNRGGLWARRDGTPFGFGRPYSLGQLETQIRRSSFAPERSAAALYQPPSRKRFWLKTGPFWERAGRRISWRFAGGVLLLEASKQIHARPKGSPATSRRPLEALEGIVEPGVRPI